MQVPEKANRSYFSPTETIAILKTQFDEACGLLREYLTQIEALVALSSRQESVTRMEQLFKTANAM